jgi:hypothetical protein
LLAGVTGWEVVFFIGETAPVDLAGVLGAACERAGEAAAERKADPVAACVSDKTLATPSKAQCVVAALSCNSLVM